jgi:hypothetical protein
MSEFRDLFREAIGFKPSCPCVNCDHETTYPEIWKTGIKEWIEFASQFEDNHPKDQITNQTELAYVECRSCGIATDHSLESFFSRFV